MNNFQARNRLFLGYGDIAMRTAKLSLDRGLQVTAMRRSQKTASNINILAGDVTQPEHLKRCIGEDTWDIALILTPDNYSEQGYRDSYLAAAATLSSVLPTISPGSRVIFVSSTSVYGQNEGQWVDESSPCQPRSDTAKVLLEAETAIADMGLNFCNLRFSGIYGPGRTRIIERTKTGVIPASEPIHWTNRIYADDCAGVIDHLFSLPEMPDTILATDSLPTPRHQVQSFIAEMLNVTVTPEPAKTDKQTPTGKRCKNDRLIEIGYEFKCTDYREGFSKLIKQEHL